MAQVSPTLVIPKVHNSKNYICGREQQFLNEKNKKFGGYKISLAQYKNTSEWSVQAML